MKTVVPTINSLSPPRPNEEESAEPMPPIKTPRGGSSDETRPTPIAQGRRLFLGEGMDGDASPTSLQATDTDRNGALGTVDSEESKESFMFRLTNKSFLDSFAELRKKIQGEQSKNTTDIFDQLTGSTSTTEKNILTSTVSPKEIESSIPSQAKNEKNNLNSENTNKIINNTDSEDLILDSKLLLSQLLAKKQGEASNTTGTYYDLLMSGSGQPLYLESQVTYGASFIVRNR